VIGSIATQPTDAGNNIPEAVSSVTLHSRDAPVTGRGAILEINARAQPMRIEYTIECRCKTSHVRRRSGCDDWKSDWGKRGKGCVAAVSGARAISGYDPEMVSGAGSQAANTRTDI